MGRHLLYNATTRASIIHNGKQGFTDDVLPVRQPPYERVQSSEARPHLPHHRQIPINNCPTKREHVNYTMVKLAITRTCS